ncbi:MAG: hypothetical protein ABJC05_03750 [Pyrinomonadaceae bacterium]
MAGYKKKRARELKHDRFRDTTMTLLDRLGNRLEGKGRHILYGLAGAVVVFLLGYAVITWRGRHTEEAERALGRGIKIATASVSSSPGADPGEVHFASEQERAQKAIEEFRKVEAKYGEPYRSEARYFIATNSLVVDRPKGISDLATLGGGSNREVATLAKFALAQAKEEDRSLDEAAALYGELAKQKDGVVTEETANLRLALVYKKQGKKKEAADLLFNIVDAARKARDADGKPASQSAAAREAATELQKIDAARYAQLPPEASAMELPLG